MDRNDIIAALLMLSQTDPFYNKFYNFITSNDEDAESAMAMLISEQFASIDELKHFIEH